MRIATSLIVLAAALSAAAASAAAPKLSFIGQQILPTATFYGGTQVGGLSGIDYIGGTSFVAISDDRSQVNNARFYTLDLALTSTAFTGVSFSKVTEFKTPAGTPYPILQIDPESIRRLPNGNYVYSSEGDTSRGIDAFIREARPDGSYVRDLTLPAGFQQTAGGPTGIRNNLAFESLTLSADGKTITSGTENALLQDGPAAAFGTGSPSRIFKLDNATGLPGAQYVYDVNPVASPSTPPGAFSTNGLVELLDIGHGQELALERSFVSGLVTPFSTTGNSIQIYLIDTNGATDVSGFASLAGQTYTPVTKTLLFDLDSLHIPLDNIEGITFGPTLENGRRSLILVSDNNFSPTQFTQFLAFEVAGVPEPQNWALLIAGFGLTGATLRRRRTALAA